MDPGKVSTAGGSFDEEKARIVVKGCGKKAKSGKIAVECNKSTGEK